MHRKFAQCSFSRGQSARPQIADIQCFHLGGIASGNILSPSPHFDPWNIGDFKVSRIVRDEWLTKTKVDRVSRRPRALKRNSNRICRRWIRFCFGEIEQEKRRKAPSAGEEPLIRIINVGRSKKTTLTGRDTRWAPNETRLNALFKIEPSEKTTDIKGTSRFSLLRISVRGKRFDQTGSLENLCPVAILQYPDDLKRNQW